VPVSTTIRAQPVRSQAESDGSPPRVSILIAAYDAEAWLDDAIYSALAQTCASTEIIVLDDGSTDNTLAVARRHNVRVETQRNAGSNAARNRLLQLSSGEWLQYLDADDHLLPQKVERQLAAAEAQLAACRSNPSQPAKAPSRSSSRTVDFAQVRRPPHLPGSMLLRQGLRPSSTTDDAPGRTRSSKDYSDRLLDVIVAPVTIDGAACRHTRGLDPWIALFEIELGSTSSILWRRDALVRVGGWDESVHCGQEYELMFRLLRAGSRIGHDDHALTVLRSVNGESVSRRDPGASMRRHATLIGDVLTHLERTGDLTPERRAAGASVLFRLARRLRAASPTSARTLVDEAQHCHPELAGDLRRQGHIYGRLLSRLGFDAAERYDALAQPFRRVLAARTR